MEFQFPIILWLIYVSFEDIWSLIHLNRSLVLVSVLVPFCRWNNTLWSNARSEGRVFTAYRYWAWSVSSGQTQQQEDQKRSRGSTLSVKTKQSLNWKWGESIDSQSPPLFYTAYKKAASPEYPWDCINWEPCVWNGSLWGTFSFSPP